MTAQVDAGTRILRQLSDARRLAERAKLSARLCDAARAQDWQRLRSSAAALANVYAVLRRDGKAVVLVPHDVSRLGGPDEVLEHKRRYSRAELEQKMHAAGLRVEKIIYFNRPTYPAWMFNSRILRRWTFGAWQLRITDSSVPLLRKLDCYLPWPANSLIAVGVKDPSNDPAKDAR